MEPPTVEWLDASKKDLLNLCPRKFYYRHELNLVPKSQGSIADFANPAQYGTAIHAGLAALYEGHGHDLVTCPCLDFAGCEFCWGERIPRLAAQFLLNYPVDPPPDDRDPRTRARGLEILTAYVEKYKRESFEVVAVEVPFELEFDGLDGKLLFTYIGRIDLLVRENGKLIPWDHKSTSRYGEAFQTQFKLSGQVTGYMRSTHEITEEPCFEAAINAIRVTTRITDESFMRLTTTRTPYEFDEWEEELREAFERIQRYRAASFWPKSSPFACSAYQRVCEYYGLCAAGSPETRANMIASAYEVKPWDPR